MGHGMSALWRALAVGAALVAYAVVSHLLMVHMPDRAWTVAALFGPLLAGLAAGAWRQRHGPTLAGCAVLLAVLVAVVARGGVDDVARLYVIQHGVIHLMLAATFGFTLRAGSVPLVTRLAERIHTRFTPAMRAYTRRVTVAWTAYFVGMVVLSVALYLLAPWPWWSFFCTMLTPAFAVAFFVGEHLWRRVVHAEFEPASLQQAWQAWKRDSEEASRA